MLWGKDVCGAYARCKRRCGGARRHQQLLANGFLGAGRVAFGNLSDHSHLRARLHALEDANSHSMTSAAIKVVPVHKQNINTTFCSLSMSNRTEPTQQNKQSLICAFERERGAIFRHTFHLDKPTTEVNQLCEGMLNMGAASA